MKTKPQRFLIPLLMLMVLSLSLAALLACTQPPADAPVESPAETETAPAGDASAARPATSPAAIADFVSRRQTISAEWDQFHSDFDQWSAGLTECHPNAMRQALNEFAVSFNDVTQRTQNLSRGKTGGELADLLIAAAQEEETALRQLRDRWQPGNVSLLENVAQARAKSALAQKSAEDRAIELRAGFEDTADPEAVAEFQAAFEPLSDQWKQLHDDYEALRDDADNLGAKAVGEGIEQHAANLKAIIDALEELPELEGSEDTIEELLTAAKAELDAFKAANDSADKASAADTAAESESKAEDAASESAATTGATESTTTESTDAAATTTTESTDSPETETTESADGAESVTADTEATDSAETAAAESSAATESDATKTTTTTTAKPATVSSSAKLPDFAPLDEIAEANAKVLKQANRAIADLADPDAEQGLAELQVFDTEYGRLLSDWDAFHDQYGDWRKDDAGCDRALVIQDLEQHSLRIAQLARDVRTLPSAGQLLPIYSLLTEAAARDENAIRALRYTWQPFTLDPFKAVHQERTNTDELRRQAEIAAQQLQNRS